MKKLVTIVFTVTVVVALFGAYRQVRAAGYERRENAPVRSVTPVSPPVVLTAHSLLTAYVDQGDSGTTVGSGYTGVDSPVTINCQSSAGCTIAAEHWLEVGESTTSGNYWAICTEVDGTTLSCPLQGYAPSDGSFLMGSFNQSTAVPPGTHTIQEVVYSANGVGIYNYHNTYNLYRP